MSDIKGIMVTLIREFMVCNGSINKGIKGVYGCVTVVCLRHTLVRCIWTVLDWTAFGMSSTMSVLVMSLFSLHGVYVVPFAILGTLKQLAFHLAHQLTSVIKNFRKTF